MNLSKNRLKHMASQKALTIIYIADLIEGVCNRPKIKYQTSILLGRLNGIKKLYQTLINYDTTFKMIIL